jgi:hypothetical protein
MLAKQVSRHPTTLATLPAPESFFALAIFQVGSCVFYLGQASDCLQPVA